MNDIRLSPKTAVLYTQDKSQLDLGIPVMLMIDDEKPEPNPNIITFAKTKSHSSYDLF